MEMLIKLDKRLYNYAKHHTLTSTEIDEICDAIANSILLPEGHGRLIDADELKKEYPHDTDWDYPVNTNCCVVESIDNVPTIIEADKEKK